MWQADGKIRVVEFASEAGAFAGKLFSLLGADVVLVEHTEGHPTRRYGPMHEAETSTSLWFAHYNLNKRSITVDVDSPESIDVLHDVLAGADVVIDAEDDLVESFGLDRQALVAAIPRLVWTTIRPFGRSSPANATPMTDLTIAAAAGPAWSCGYDDHTLAPVTPGGNQSLHTAATWAVMGAMTALHQRNISNRGQEVDVSSVAASNITTEVATYEWLVRKNTVQRQTGRHAAIQPTTQTWAVTKDERYVNTGVGARTGPEFRIIKAWMEELGLLDTFDDAIFIEFGCDVTRLDPAQIGIDAEVTAIFAAGRDALKLIAGCLTGREFFLEGQRRGYSTAIVHEPAETLDDEHFIARGVVIDVDDDQLGRSVKYVGSPFQFSGSPKEFRRAPTLGEHNQRISEPASI